MDDRSKHVGDTVTGTIDRATETATDAISTIQKQAEHAQSVASDAIGEAGSLVRTVGDQARTLASDAGATAQDVARRARERADAMYQQGTRAGEYVARQVDAYPLTALLVAGAIGYGLAYLIHHSSDE